MGRITTAVAVALLGLIVLPAFAVDKDDKDKKDPAVPEVKKADDAKKPDDPKKDDAKKADDAKKDDAKKDEPKKADAKKDDPKKADDAKKADAKKDDAKKEDKKEASKKEESSGEKWIKLENLMGKVVEINETKKSIKLQMTTTIQKPNPGKMQAMAAAQAQLAQAMAKRDANGVRQAQQSMAQASAIAPSIERRTQDVEVAGTDDLLIRQAAPPVAYDDKGKPMKRSAKELKELKGDPKLPGFPGEFTDLHTGQSVVVTIVKKKEAPVHHTTKSKEKDPTGEANLPETNLIEIVAEAPAK